MKKTTYFILVIVTICCNAICVWAQSWRALPGNSLDGSVSAIISFGGYIWLGGAFTYVGVMPANYVVRHDGSNWVSADSLPSTPYGFCVFNNNLYALGGFRIDTSLYGLMKWNGASWIPVAKIGPYNGSGQVRTACVYNGSMIFAGRFTSVEGLPIEYIARFDGTNYYPLSLGTTQCSWMSMPIINDVYVANGYVYIGGIFDQLCGQSAYCAARWNGFTMQPMSVAVWSTVSKFSSAAGVVHVAGIFQNAGSASSQAIARDVNGSWQNDGNGAKLSGMATDCHLGKLYVGGQKAFGGGDGVGNCGYWNGSQWVPDNSGICVNGNESVYVLYTDPTTGIMYAGGNFNSSLGDVADYIAYKSEIHLPVDLMYFKCREEGNAYHTFPNYIVLEWATAVEVNADYFCVAVSKNGFDFEDIGNVDAFGTTSLEHLYSLNYYPRENGTYYFRLEQFDWDGICKGIWYTAANVFSAEAEMHYSQNTQRIVCEECDGFIFLYSSSGSLIKKSRPPISTDQLESGSYVAVRIPDTPRQSSQNKIQTLRFVVP